MTSRKYRKWCLNGCGKTVTSTWTFVNSDRKHLYRCSDCGATYVLEGKILVRYDKNGNN